MKKLLLIRIIVAIGITISGALAYVLTGFANIGNQQEAFLGNGVIDGEILETQNFYLPVIVHRTNVATTPVIRRINAPFLDVENVTAEKLTEMAIAWFGQITPTMNYADIRVGFNDDSIYVHLEVIDRLLWYDENPNMDEFETWDSASLYLSLDGNTGTSPDLQAYRFDAQLNFWEEREPYQVAYRGNGSDWENFNTSFETISGWRGNSPNDELEDRGWMVVFKIPFTSLLGQPGRPPDGTTWGMGVELYDRDDIVGTPIQVQSWPENVNGTIPNTWGQLHFGFPIFTPASITPNGQTTIRHKLNGTIVQDVAVGGTTTNLCPGDSYYIWNLWGNRNFAGIADFNIQNQADVADWPCFSKYYINFPLDSISKGKEIISAELTLYQFGNAGNLNDPDPINWPYSSLIQVLSVVEEWDETTLTWNNAPLASENISQTWVSPLGEFPNWPGEARVWDVSYAVAQAYSTGQPLNLVLYEADAARHSGKYFSSSDTGDWNENGRPTLEVTWGDP